jgi:putative ABC transport system ATP-binding protein
MSTSAQAINLQNLRFRYSSEFELHLPSLEIEAASRVVCLGPSGCGKTTFLHLVAGILPALSGRLQVLGQDLHAMNDIQRRAFRIAKIGLVFQEFELLEYLTAEENLYLPFQINPALRPGADLQSYAKRLTDQLGLSKLLSRRPAALSQGERQRVAVGRALITRPELVLCDEPTGNLDPEATVRSLDLLFEQCQAVGATLLVVSHDRQILDRFDQIIDLSAVIAGATE